MPTVSTADKARLRQPNQFSRWGIAVFRPPVIATASISGSPGQGATTINLSGYSATDTVEAYYSVIVGDSSGDDSGGKVRLKSVNDGGNSISVATNNIEWSSYSTISILRVIEPDGILPDLANDRMDNDVAYTDENENYRPLARIGPPAIGYVGEAVKFWSNSGAYNEGVFDGSIASHAWTFPDGSPASSSLAGTAGSPIEVTWSAATGHIPHYIKYVATDSAGKTHTRFNPVWIIESFTQDFYCNFSVESLGGDYSDGSWSGRIEIKGQATTSEFPQDAMVVIVAEDWYGGEKVSVGGNWTHRENIIFMGWIVRGTVFKDADTGHVNFEVYGTVKKLDQITDWPANLEYKNDPGRWDELKNMTCDLAALHILRERTTIDYIVDINLTGNTKTLRYVDIPETSIVSQLDDYCLSPIGARVLSDRQGQIYFSRNPNLRPLAERSGITQVMELEFDDMRGDPGLELGVEEQEYRCAQVDFIGFTYDGLDTTPFYSLAPARQYPTGRVEKVDGVRVDSQNEANVLSGMYLANFNNIWNQNRIPLFNYRVFDICPEHYILLSLAAADTKRGIVWDQQKLLARNVDITFDEEKEAIEVEINCEKDSFGPPGVGGGYPTSINRESAPTPVPDPPGLAAAAWASFYFRRSTADSWTDRSPDAEATLKFGCVDPWWFSRYKQNSLDPDNAIVYAAHTGGVLLRSNSGGRSWATVTLTDPGNDWSDSPAPTIDDIDLVWIAGDNHRNSRFYVLAEWQEESNDDWRGWIGVTDDDFDTLTWYPVAYGVAETITNLRPLGVEANLTNVLITAWVEGGSGNPRLRLYLYDPEPFAFAGEWALGDASETEVDDKTYVAYPLTVIDEPEEWFIYGRMNSPTTTGVDPAHIIRYNRGSWTIIESGWGDDLCGSFKASSKDDHDRRRYYAVRNASVTPGDPVLIDDQSSGDSPDPTDWFVLVRHSDTSAYLYGEASAPGYATYTTGRRLITAGSGISVGSNANQTHPAWTGNTWPEAKKDIADILWLAEFIFASPNYISGVASVDPGPGGTHEVVGYFYDGDDTTDEATGVKGLHKTTLTNLNVYHAFTMVSASNGLLCSHNAAYVVTNIAGASEAAVFSNAIFATNDRFWDAAHSANGKALVFYKNGANWKIGRVAVSGTSASLTWSENFGGSPYPDGVTLHRVIFAITEDYYLLSYSGESGAGPQAMVVQDTGSGLAYGSPVDLNSVIPNINQVLDWAVLDSTNLAVVYSDDDGAGNNRLRVATLAVSGTTLTWGNNPLTILSSASSMPVFSVSMVALTATKALVSYRDPADTNIHLAEVSFTG